MGVVLVLQLPDLGYTGGGKGCCWGALGELSEEGWSGNALPFVFKVLVFVFPTGIPWDN